MIKPSNFECGFLKQDDEFYVVRFWTKGSCNLRLSRVKYFKTQGERVKEDEPIGLIPIILNEDNQIKNVSFKKQSSMNLHAVNFVIKDDENKKQYGISVIADGTVNYREMLYGE